METIEIPSIGEFPASAGIYKFTNKTNGKIYIGETINFKHRMHGHVSKSYNKDWTAVVTHAFRKYGFDGFKYEIIENYPLGSVTKEFLLEREAFYIKELDAMNVDVGYNRCPYGANTIGYKFSEESRKKMSIARKKRVMKRESIEKSAAAIRGEKHWNYGNPMTQERKDKLLAAKIEKGITLSERQSKSKGHINSINKKRVALCQIDATSGQIVNIWRSGSDAARSFGKESCSDLLTAARNPLTKSAYGYKWRIATDEEKSLGALKTFYKEGFQCRKQTSYKKKFCEDKSDF